MNLIESFDALFAKLRPHFNRPETYERARALAISSLVTYGRHTITRLICSRARQLQDWSADYKFYSKREWDAQALFFEVLKHCDPHSHWPEDAVVMAMDDSLYRKTGKQIASVRTLRDPMSLPFHTNLIRGVRFIQASVLITHTRGEAPIRAGYSRLLRRSTPCQETRQTCLQRTQRTV